MMIHEITEKVGRHASRKRVGRGRSSGYGKTSGRGHKGARSRAGYSRRAYFEGGQMSWVRRIPKRGFTNARFRNHFAIVNIKTLEETFDDGAEITIEALVENGIARDTKLPLKVLGEGDLTKKFTVIAAKFSASARTKIEGAGGTATDVVKVKWTRQAAGPSKRRPHAVKGARGAKKGSADKSSQD